MTAPDEPPIGPPGLPEAKRVQRLMDAVEADNPGTVSAVISEAYADRGAPGIFELCVGIAANTLYLRGIPPTKPTEDHPARKLQFVGPDGPVSVEDLPEDACPGEILSAQFVNAVSNMDITMAKAMFVTLAEEHQVMDFLEHLVEGAADAFKERPTGLHAAQDLLSRLN